MRPIKKNYFIILFCYITLIFCVKEYNPFEDVNNVKVLYSTSFGDNKQLTIFSPETLYISPLVKEKIDSFSISAPGNIFWTDTTLRNDSISINSLYRFLVSFKDTGSTEIVTTTYLSNSQFNKKTTDQIQVISPLSQEPISIYLGSYCTLSTPGVRGENVLYNWSLGNNNNYSSKIPVQIIILNTAPPKSAKCSLWVSDMSGMYRSPKVPFQASFYDTVAPEIVYQNFMGLLSKDTIYSGNNDFIFLTEIYDQGNSAVEKTWINSHPFEYYDPAKNFYWNIFDNSQMQSNNKPLQITVKAMDQYANIITKDFWLCFDSTFEQDNIAFLTVDNADSEVVTNSNHWITGKVYNFSPDSLVLTNVVNGIDTMYQSFIIPMNSDMVSWKWNVKLIEDYNHLTIRLQKMSDKSIVIEKSLSIFLNKELLDTIGPTIISIMVNDTFPYTGSEMFFPEDSVTISVVATDINSEVDKILIDSTELFYKAQKQHWRNKFYLSHDTKLNKLLSIFDSNSNKTTKYLTIFQNTKPKLLKNKLTQPLLFVGREYHDSISLLDMENDPITVTYVKSEPWITNGVNLYFKPTLNDTGRGSIVFTISDGLQNTDTLTWYYAVSEDFVTVEFDSVMTGSLFDTILAGTNQLSINLSAKNGILPYHYEVLLSPVNTVLLDTSADTSFFWTPLIQDTGHYTLCFYIEDINHTKDTLFHPIYVKPNYTKITDLTMIISPDTLPVTNDTIDVSGMNDSSHLILTFLINSNSRGMYSVTVHNQDSLVNQFETDDNQFTIEKMIRKSLVLETIMVKVTDHWDNFRTKTIYLKNDNPVDSIIALLPSDVAGCLWFDATDTMTVHCMTGGKVRKWESKFPKDIIEFVSDDDVSKKPVYISNPFVIQFNPKYETYLEVNGDFNFLHSDLHIITVSLLDNKYYKDFFSILSFTDSENETTYSVGYSHFYHEELDVTSIINNNTPGGIKKSFKLFPSKGVYNIIRTTYTQSTGISTHSVNSKESTENLSNSFSGKEWDTFQVGGVKTSSSIEHEFHGNIAEIIIIPRKLPADTLLGIEKYLAEKYGITLTP